MFGRRNDGDDDRRGSGEKLVWKLARWTRTWSFLSFGVAPLLLIWQGLSWMQVRYWGEISLGTILFPDPDTRGFDAGKLRPVKDLLWIPLWVEFILAGIVLFVLHMILVNYVDAKREERRRTRRSTPGYKEGQRRRRSSK